MSEIFDLADGYYDYRQSTDHVRLLWKGDLDQLAGWEDVSPSGIDARLARLRAYADHADSVTADGDRDRSLLETISFTARSAANQLIWRSELEWPNPEVGLHTRLMTFLPRYPLMTVRHGSDYHDKLRGLPTMLRDMGAAISAAATEGRAALTSHLVRSAASIDAHLVRPDDPLLAQTAPTDMSRPEAEAWTASTAALVDDNVRPALARLRDVLAAAADSGRPDSRPGLVHLDGGADLYRDLVWSHTSMELSGEEVHQIGLNQVAHLEDEYLDVAGELFRADTVSEIYRRLRDDAELRYFDGEALVADATAALHRAAAEAPNWFGSLPASECVANGIEQGPLAFYSRPIPEAGKPGQFFFNVSEPAAWSRYQIEAVTYHESIPGHHLQLALTTESDDLHGVHIELPVTAYSEGWGLYTERLADEMGLYSTRLDRLGMLAADSMRACRLVTDTGMHALGWSRSEAIDYVMSHSPLSRKIAEGEIDRYIGHPGQALSYMIGRLEIDRIRSESEQRGGFDIKAFHDRVLGNGAVPLETLRRNVLG